MAAVVVAAVGGEAVLGSGSAAAVVAAAMAAAAVVAATVVAAALAAMAAAVKDVVMARNVASETLTRPARVSSCLIDAMWSRPSTSAIPLELNLRCGSTNIWPKLRVPKQEEL